MHDDAQTFNIFLHMMERDREACELVKNDFLSRNTVYKHDRLVARYGSLENQYAEYQRTGVMNINTIVADLDQLLTDMGKKMPWDTLRTEVHDDAVTLNVFLRLMEEEKDAITCVTGSFMPKLGGVSTRTVLFGDIDKQYEDYKKDGSVDMNRLGKNLRTLRAHIVDCVDTRPAKQNPMVRHSIDYLLGKLNQLPGITAETPEILRAI